MGKAIDTTGMRFGKLLANEPTENCKGGLPCPIGDLRHQPLRGSGKSFAKLPEDAIVIPSRELPPHEYFEHDGRYYLRFDFESEREGRCADVDQEDQHRDMG